MERLTAISIFVVLNTLSNSFIYETNEKYYVTPSKAIRCSNDQTQISCLTLQEYASQPDKYFKSNTIFYFEPGIHRLNSSLNLTNIHYFTFHGLSATSNGTIYVLLSSLGSFTWKNCSNIEVSSIVFSLIDNFTFIIMFEYSYDIQVSNISVYGNRYIGCSAVMIRQSIIDISYSNFFFIQGYYGAAMTISGSYANFTGNNTFIGNTASFGGSLYLFVSVLTMNGTNIFANNKASNQILNCKRINYPPGEIITSFISAGGAIYCILSIIFLNSNYHDNIKILFTNNYVLGSGGAISTVGGMVTIQGSTIFMRNIALAGGAMYLGNMTLIVHENIYFLYNIATNSGGAISFYRSQYRNLKFVKYYGNRANYRGGALSIYTESTVMLGNASFEVNSAVDGGAMSFDGTSKLILPPPVTISFVQNYAQRRGGALYHEDSQCSLGSTECFLSIHSNNSHYASKNILLLFLNNSAGSLGGTLYGGQFNKCRIYYRTNNKKDKCGNTDCNSYSDDALGMFMTISRIIQHNKSKSATNISSHAEQINFCEDENYRYNFLSDISLHPGERFNISIIALDQSGSPVPATLFYQNQYTDDKHRLSPSSQKIAGSCTNITFQFFSVESNYHIDFKLYPENLCQSLVNGLGIRILILACPIGFELLDHRCVCNVKLLKFTQKCYIDNSRDKIERIKNNFWISKINTDILIIHGSRCPLDYCKDISINVSLSDPSVQCDFNRTGTLCGQCLKNFSLGLGSLHCIPCDNDHAALIVLFILAGVALISIIFLLRLTVSFGTLNGLFLYTNIVQANHQAFFPRATINFFTVFISWINLDFGIESCFYDGMDIYAYSWFQFLFPFYLWFLVGCIILLCRYSRSIARQFGQNPVAVLATLLLMSYSKILQASIVPLSFTHLRYYNSSNDLELHRIIWLYEGSIDYFKDPKHIALGFFAILSLVVLVLPYISLLLFGHWLQGCSNWWILSWLNKLKPFMDAYHAPYKKHTRYWTGLLLLSQLGLFLTFAINANGNESVNILAISSVSIGLLAVQKRVYEHRWKDLLESFFIVNLGIFSVATFYLKKESGDSNSQLILSGISVGVAFITFIGILLFHVGLVLKSSNIWTEYIIPFIQKSLLFNKIFRMAGVKDVATTGHVEATVLRALPTTTEVAIDLNKPLLEITADTATYN